MDRPFFLKIYHQIQVHAQFTRYDNVYSLMFNFQSFALVVDLFHSLSLSSSLSCAFCSFFSYSLFSSPYEFFFHVKQRRCKWIIPSTAPSSQFQIKQKKVKTVNLCEAIEWKIQKFLCTSQNTVGTFSFLR